MKEPAGQAMGSALCRALPHSGGWKTNVDSLLQVGDLVCWSAEVCIMQHPQCLASAECTASFYGCNMCLLVSLKAHQRICIRRI